MRDGGLSEDLTRGEATPFSVRRPPGPDGAPPPTPLVFATPHSGRLYPQAMLDASLLSPEAIRGSEDAYVDTLIAAAPAAGATVIEAQLARAWVDLNRDPWELDPGMYEDELPAFARARTARVAAGLGSIARVVGEGREIYARKLMFAEAKDRIETAHQPYHEALTQLLAEAKAAHGVAILIDWHSMPSAAARRQRGGACDIVLGDRFGAACSAKLTGLAERELTAMGYACARNAPYAGGYTTEFYGRPARKVHALQIEISRALYLDEASMQPTAGLERVAGDIARLTEALAAADWKSLR
jgi:N-formylglutamate amidohydrolase